MSFRQTIRATMWSDRGFRIIVDQEAQRVVVEFDSGRVDSRHDAWLKTVEERIGLGSLDPEPYWPLQELELKVSTKMLNSFYVEIETTKADGNEHFMIKSVRTLQGFGIEGFIRAIEEGAAYVDFDARTHHNHGTKFRLKEDALPKLYKYVEQVA